MHQNIKMDGWMEGHTDEQFVTKQIWDNVDCTAVHVHCTALSILLSLVDLFAGGLRWLCRSENITHSPEIKGPGFTLNKPAGLEEDFQVLRDSLQG